MSKVEKRTTAVRGIAWEPDRFIGRLAYYAKGMVREVIPDCLLRVDIRARLAAIAGAELPADLSNRVAYYNKLDSIDRNALTCRLDAVDKSMSRYYYDLAEVARGFGRHRKLNYLFGDVTHTPNQPTFVRSRPIADNNANAVLLNLDRLRHFRFPADAQAFDDKRPSPVWRGTAGNPVRRQLVRRFHDSGLGDIGHSGHPFEGLPPKDFLTIKQQRRHRYIISIEGNDVATNLKWILSSNSLCFSPALTYETWFMEGRLRPGVHFVQVAPDFSDLEEKVDFYNRNPAKAKQVIANAHSHVAQFRCRATERLISLLVVQKYLELSSQLPDGLLPYRLFG